ncbi:hypothetical protein [Poseidonocella sp. HB161398]|uniref:hypothetical protein n=1 Tax=Poseidonocella sp. HB161398 TaxID=2320855 RepID=UPI001109AD4D|nr:hypothetical protein [Poseidonocella sp. HB161398]
MGTEALAQLYPSKTRIILTVLVLAAVAVVCLYVAAGEGGQGAAARLMLAAVAVAAALGAVAVWRSGARGLLLYPDRIAESGGDTVLWLADIARLERGAFAFKPANGVVVSLRRPGSLRWVPGLWWRTGARVGIGGMTPKAATKAFADLLERRLGELGENG